MTLDEGVESILVEAFIEELIRETQNTKDRCVVSSCKKETIYDKSIHINQRQFYVEGAGQLCESCFKIYCSDEIINGEY